MTAAHDRARALRPLAPMSEYVTATSAVAVSHTAESECGKSQNKISWFDRELPRGVSRHRTVAAESEAAGCEQTLDLGIRKVRRSRPRSRVADPRSPTSTTIFSPARAPGPAAAAGGAAGRGC